MSDTRLILGAFLQLPDERVKVTSTVCDHEHDGTFCPHCGTRRDHRTRTSLRPKYDPVTTAMQLGLKIAPGGQALYLPEACVEHDVEYDEIDFLGLEEVGPNFEERSVARLTDHLAGKETPPEATIVYGLLVQTPDIYIGY